MNHGILVHAEYNQAVDTTRHGYYVLVSIRGSSNRSAGYNFFLGDTDRADYVDEGGALWEIQNWTSTGRETQRLALSTDQWKAFHTPDAPYSLLLVVGATAREDACALDIWYTTTDPTSTWTETGRC